MGKDASKNLISKGLLEILPLAYVRGISIDNSIVIIDEVQNFTDHIFKTIITRIGENSKYIFLGDSEQIDRKHIEESCLSKMLDIFKDSDLMGVINFTEEDCVRNPKIPKILNILKEHNI